MRMLEDVIIKPIISEASMDMVAQKKYVFKVAKTADKAEIARAVEAMFPGTKVEAVNTINMKRKPKSLGVHSGYTKSWKKAIVTLKAGSKSIEFFDGMI
jgi:large subunit ribosomal protein L23